MAHQFKYIIVGGGLAGASAIEGIRSRDTSGSIALFCKEGRLPYDRPPLSKGLWLGKTTLDKIPVHEESFYASNNVHVHLNTEITEIHPSKNLVGDSKGNRYVFDKLLLSTGGTPRTLSFGAGVVQYYRTVEDYLALKEVAERQNEFVIVGGGFIGAELAAALNLHGKKVTMTFPEECILQKLLPHDLGTFVTEYYKKKGVRVLPGDVATSVERSGGKVQVKTRSGKTLAADSVIAAIGLNLHGEIWKRAGLKTENGLIVNEFLQTSVSNIYAAGDITNFPASSLGKRIRIEHWDNARAQGKMAGENMAGIPKPYLYLPYFWSDLFELGFEAIGDLDSRLTTFADWKEEFREGVVYYLDSGQVRGVLLWNVWEKVDAARELIKNRKAYVKPDSLRGIL